MHVFSSSVDSRGTKSLQLKIRVTSSGIIQPDSLSLKAFASGIYLALRQDSFWRGLVSELNGDSVRRYNVGSQYLLVYSFVYSGRRKWLMANDILLESLTLSQAHLNGK
jgi:hypothetical protein